LINHLQNARISTIPAYILIS